MLKLWILLICLNFCRCDDKNTAWKSFHNSILNPNRLELVVSKVKSEEIIPLEHNVTKWKTLTIGPTCYSVGISGKGLQILVASLNQNKTTFTIHKNFKSINNTPSDLALFHNRNQGKSEAIIVVSFVNHNEISWYKISELHHVQNFWSWSVEHPVNHINILNIGTRRFLFYITNENNAYIYEFNIKTPFDKWFIQKIHLEYTTNSSAFNYFDNNYYLSIPQKNVVEIYRFSELRFIYFTEIKTPSVTFVVNFDVGFKTFLGLDGKMPGIFEFTPNGLKKQHIVNSNLKEVIFLLPITIQTIRDDVLLLTQRILDHSTHHSYKIDIINYNYDKFEEHEDIPCSFFGETTNTLTGLSHNDGISKSTFVVIEDKIGLLSPLPNGSLVLYSIDTKIKENPYPKEKELMQLLENKKKIEIKLEDVSKNFEEITELFNTNPPVKIKSDQNEIVGESQNLTHHLLQVEKIGLKVDKLHEEVENLINKEANSNYNTIIINNEAVFENKVTAKTVNTQKINGEHSHTLMSDIILKNNINQEVKNKSFMDLEVESLNTRTINGVDVKNVAFNDGLNVVLNGSITFNKPVTVDNIRVTSRKINEILFEDMAVISGKAQEDTLEFNQIRVEENFLASRINNVNLEPNGKTSKSKRNLSDDLNDTLTIKKNLTVNFINGENFTEFFHSLCMINKVCYIQGSVKIKEIKTKKVEADFLNGLKFPDEYILLDSKSNGNIQSKKIFKNTLVANDVRSSSTVNGIDTKNLVTLSTAQNLENFTFGNIELTEELDVGGKISGEYADKFLTNPTLQETNHILSNINFKNLEVNGNVFIDQNFNNNDFKSILESLLYDDAKETVINATKDFKKGLIIDGAFHIKSNSINTIDLNKFVTKNTDQVLKNSILNGDVVINNLFVNGLYDGKDVKTIDDNLVKLSGNQFVESTLSFEDLVVENMEIDKKLNGLKADEYLYIDRIKLDKDIHFSNIVVENLTIEGNLKGKIIGFDLDSINNKYLSKTKNQSISLDFNIDSSSIDNLKLVNKNNDGIFDDESYQRIIEELLNDGNLTIENLRLKDSINIKTINEKDANNILPVTLLDIAKQNGNKLTFENNVFLKDLEITNLTTVNWNNYINQLVYKNQTKSNLSFKGTKNFAKGLTVNNLIETKNINKIDIRNVLTKEGEQVIRGPVEFEGDIVVETVDVKEKVNDVIVDEFLKIFSVTNNGGFFYKHDLVFKRLPYIKSLEINGTVNNHNIKELLDNLVYKNNTDVVIKNDIVFTKTVNISGNLGVSENFNTFNFSNMLSNIVFTSQDADIKGLVLFSKDVEIEDKLTIEEDLITKLISKLNTKTLQDKAVYVNRGFLKDHYKMDEIEINSKLTTNFINDLDMTKVIPLKSKQSLDHLHFGVLNFFKNITVGQKVNEMYLPNEYSRTFMSNKDQKIKPRTIFKNVLVRQNLKTTFLNNKITSKIVTTNSNQNLTAKYNFNSKIILDSNFNVHGLINNVDYDKWKQNTLKLNSSSPQHISNKWKLLKNLTFMEDVNGVQPISNLNLPKVAEDLQKRKDLQFQLEHNIIKDHIGICTTITSFYNKAKTQIYKYKYFEDHQEIQLTSTINYVYNFVFRNSQYMFINYQNCLSDIMIYNGKEFVGLSLGIPTGLIAQAVRVISENTLYLVLREDVLSPCNQIKSTKVWEFNGTTIQVKFNMEQQIILHDSRVPLSFYSISKEGVIEYKIKKVEGLIKYRKWLVPFNENIEFIPRGLKTGLAVRTKEKVYLLDRTEPTEQLDLDTDKETILIGSFKENANNFFPGKTSKDIAVVNVGIRNAKKTLLAVADHEETTVKGSLDFIKIYEKPFNGKLFDKVVTYNPSSLISIEFGQGETLLAFLEDKRKVHFFEYKGIEGFRHRQSFTVKGANSLIKFDLDQSGEENAKDFGIIFRNKIRILRAVMDGIKISNDWNCDL